MPFVRSVLPILICGFLFAGCSTPLGGKPDPEIKKGEIPAGYMKHLCQPNGWGDTPEKAIADLRTRILPWYERNFGHKPGFEIDWEWYALVEVADGRLWQADGRLWWYAPKVKRPGQPQS